MNELKKLIQVISLVFSISISGYSQKIRTGSNYLVFETTVYGRLIDEYGNSYSKNIRMLKESEVSKLNDFDTVNHLLGVVNVRNKKLVIKKPLWNLSANGSGIGYGPPNFRLKYKYRLISNSKGIFQIRRRSLSKKGRWTHFGRVFDPLDSKTIIPDSIPYFAWREFVEIPNSRLDLKEFFRENRNFLFYCDDVKGSIEKLDSIYLMKKPENSWNSVYELQLGKYPFDGLNLLLDGGDGLGTGLLFIVPQTDGPSFLAKSVSRIDEQKLSTINFQEPISPSDSNSLKKNLLGKWTSVSVELAQLRLYDYHFIPIKDREYELDFLVDGSYILKWNGEKFLRGTWDVTPGQGIIMFTHGPIGEPKETKYEPIFLQDNKLEMGHGFAPKFGRYRKESGAYYESIFDWKVVFQKD